MLGSSFSIFGRTYLLTAKPQFDFHEKLVQKIYEAYRQIGQGYEFRWRGTR